LHGRLRAHSGVRAGLFLLYAAAVVWLTWPLAAQLGTHLPETHPACNFDLTQTAWVLAHETRALTQAPTTFADAPIYHPTRGALFYADAAFAALPFFAPPFLLTGNPTLAVNLAFLVPAALTALALHLVVRTWTGSHPAGAIAAWTFLTTRWTLWEFAPSAPQYVALLWFPFIILLATHAPSRRRDLGLAALIALQSLSSPVYVTAAVLLPLAVIALGRLVRRDRRRDGLRLMGSMALALLALTPLVYGYAAVRAANPALANQTYWQWWHPTTLLPWGPFGAEQIATAVQPIAFALAGAGLVALVLPRSGRAAPVGWRAFGHAAFWAVAGLVMSVGPRATWNGVLVRIPQTVLAEWVPLYGTLREPARLGVAGLMGLSLAAGLAFAALVARLPLRGRTAAGTATLLAVLVGAEMYREYAAAGPFARPPLPATYPTMRPAAATDPLVRALGGGEGPVLEIPVGLQIYGPIPGYQTRAMYRAIFHRRPLLNGYGGYWPDGFIARMELASRLPDPRALAALRAETGLTTVVVNLGDLDPRQRVAWQTTLAGGSPWLRPLGAYDDAVVLDARAD
jgi:hypothetical protein